MQMIVRVDGDVAISQTLYENPRRHSRCNGMPCRLPTPSSKQQQCFDYSVLTHDVTGRMVLVER
jgi:hypothetical protein